MHTCTHTHTWNLRFHVYACVQVGEGFVVGQAEAGEASETIGDQTKIQTSRLAAETVLHNPVLLWTSSVAILRVCFLFFSVRGGPDEFSTKGDIQDTQMYIIGYISRQQSFW